MMTCKDFINQLTSGQLKKASLKGKIAAQIHMLRCITCRTFYKNDAKLDKLLLVFKESKTDFKPEPPEK